MADALIGKVPVLYSKGKWTPDPARMFEATRLRERMDALARDGPCTVTVEVKKTPRYRTLAQNRMMWRLLQIMALATDGGRRGGTTAEDCYLTMLEECGAEVDYVGAPLAARQRLLHAYRVVKIIELHPGNMATFKCVAGSSNFTSAEMHDFIEAIFDRLADMGVDDAEVTNYYQNWRAGNVR